MNKKELYACPETEVLELSIENGILGTSTVESNQLPGWEYGETL